MLVAQATVEGVLVFTADALVAQSPGPIGRAQLPRLHRRVIWRRLGRERSHIRFREGRDAARARQPENQVTEWDSFRALDFKRLAELMTSPSIVDLRNVYRPEDVRRRFRYVQTS
jgi:hypothetical protein